MIHGGALPWLACFAVLGCAPWYLTNALFSQVPVLVNEQPEGDQISSVMAVATQVGNVFLAIYLLLRRRLHNKHSDVIGKSRLAAEQGQLAVQLCCVNSSALATTIAGAGLWRWKGSQWSYGLVLLAVLSGGFGSLQNAILWPYTATFGSRVTAAATVGGSLSSILPAALSAIQFCNGNNVEDLLFSVPVFFLISSSVFGFSVIFLLYMHLHGHTHAHMLVSRRVAPTTSAEPRGTPVVQSQHSETMAADTSASETDTLLESFQSTRSGTPYNPWRMWLLAQGATCAGNFFLMAIVPYLASNLPHHDAILVAFTVTGLTMGALGRIASAATDGDRSYASPPRLPLGQIALQSGLFAAPLILHEAATIDSLSTGAAVLLGACGVIAYGGYNFGFGFLNTQLYKSIEGQGLCPMVAARQLGVSEQVGAATGSLIAFLLQQYVLY
mmetsp:Transcript_3339/g.12091  ORF Transcript_3339/g.12091 Transcript_3339/m.12091 type:complete len:442 (-) Transcript_3339:1728-3053(-)|eukprot:scaffold3311_cov411-Prasinococcus_capsulatus_cf.AAC.10